jgi:hypothetical protein
MGLISNGTTIFDAGALDSGLTKGAITFIKKLTASSSATLSFVDGASSVVLDDTYKEYLFTFKNIHSSGNDTSAKFSFNVSIDGGSNYNVAKTTSFISSYFGEDGSDAELAYRTNDDLGDATGFQLLTNNGNNANDGNLGGTLHLFNPASTVFTKHFISSISTMHSQPAAVNSYIAGYANTTSAVDAIQFKMNSGTIDSGDICMYGIS